MRIIINQAILAAWLVLAAGSATLFCESLEGVKTGFTILVGFPAAETAPQEYVLLGPGVVVPLYESSESTPPGESRQLIDKSLSLAKAAEKLWATFRLDPARKRQEGVKDWLYPGKALDLPVLKDVGVRVSVILQKSTDTLATYKILFQKEEKTLADSTVQVLRGGRAVVGGMDGKEAPYVFLLVEPEKAGSSSPAPSSANRREWITEPRILEKVNPDYPEDCKKESIQGEVVLKVLIKEDGRVEGVEVLQAPDPRLAEAAKAAILRWLFAPARDKEDNPVRVFSTITMRFALK
jgi:TonB family protein